MYSSQGTCEAVCRSIHQRLNSLHQSAWKQMSQKVDVVVVVIYVVVGWIDQVGPIFFFVNIVVCSPVCLFQPKKCLSKLSGLPTERNGYFQSAWQCTFSIIYRAYLKEGHDPASCSKLGYCKCSHQD